MPSLTILLPLVVFLLILLTVSWKLANVKANKNFDKEYFLANSSLGGVVLAMTLVATYGSVSSFVSGPGVAWSLGLSWVVFASPQIIAGFFILGIIGKKLALVSRKTKSLTLIDVLYVRFQSKFLAILLSIIMLVFFISMIVGQFIGGAQIFTTITDLDYKWGLLLFSVVTIIYTSSGFKAVAITDALCAILMLVGMFALYYCTLEGTSFSEIFDYLGQQKLNEDGKSALLSFNSFGALPLNLLFSAWILVGFATVALPQSAVRCMTYKSTRDLHRAMIVATIICGALMIGMTFIGVLARYKIQEHTGSTDTIIPRLIVDNMPMWLAGITIIGPIAATMSTVSSLLIAASSTIIKDIFEKRLNAIENNTYLKDYKDRIDFTKKKKFAYLVNYTIGIIAIILALYPQDIVVWINMFAFGGLETAFLCPLVLGLFSKNMNKEGAILSVLLGLIVYTLFMIFKVNLFDFHNVVYGLLASFIGAIIGIKCFKNTDNNTLKIFFG